MIELSNNRIIDEPIIDILYKLRRDLLKHNINKLNDIILKGPNALITCPQHKGGREHKPSCYIRLTEGDNVKEGTVYCFTCKYKTNFTRFISNCFDLDDEGLFGEKWLLNNCELSFLTDKRDLKKINLTSLNNKEKPQEYVSKEELQSYRFYHPYMFKRKLTEDIINKFDIGYDKKTNCVTFPVYDENNNCLFVVKRNVSFKKFYIPPNINKAIFGLNQIPKDCKEVIVCESVFNALTCWVYGKVGIALFGTGSKEQIETLRKLPIRKLILAFDGDEAGRKADIKFRNSLSKDKLIKSYHLPEGKDINDLSKEEFLSLKEY